MRISILTPLAILALVGTSWGQNVRLEEPAKILKPKGPPTRQELERRDSLHHYVAGLQYEREERLADALKEFEEAARLDPEAAAPLKAQLAILIGMDRFTDALNTSKKALALNPGDYGTWYVQGKLLKTLAKYPDAIASLERGLKSAALKDHPEAAQQMYFELGSLYETTDKHGSAADAYNKAAAILEHPDLIMAKGQFPREAILARAAETYEKIGQLYRRAKQYDEAMAALRKAQERSPDRAPRLNFTLAQLAEEAGNPQQALTFIDAYLDTLPLSLDPYELKVNLLRRVKQTKDIVPWLEKTAERDQNNTALQLLLAKEYASAKMNQKAEALYEKLAENSPSPDLYRGLFHLYKDEGRPGVMRILNMLDKVMDKSAQEGPAPIGTVRHARAMVGALGDDGDLARNLVEVAFRQMKGKNELKFDTVFFLALLADKHRKNDEAERFYRQCLNDKNVSLSNEAVIYGGLLRVLGRAKKQEAVVEICEHGLKHAKTTNPLLFYSDAGRALAALHRYDDALDFADRGLKHAGDKSQLVFQLLRLRILSMAERYKDAETECVKLIGATEKTAEVVELRYVLSNIYSAAKKQEKSEEQLQLILKIDPHSATVNNDLGYLWADQGKNLEAAESMIRKALDLDRSQRRKSPSYDPDDDKDNAAYVDSLGWVLFRRGQLDEARKELERAVSLDEGGDPVIYEHLGDVYMRLKMRPEASRAWQRALDLYHQGVRGKEEERVRDIQRKLNLVNEEIGGR